MTERAPRRAPDRALHRLLSFRLGVRRLELHRDREARRPLVLADVEVADLVRLLVAGRGPVAVRVAQLDLDAGNGLEHAAREIDRPGDDELGRAGALAAVAGQAVLART